MRNIVFINNFTDSLQYYIEAEELPQHRAAFKILNAAELKLDD